MIALLPEPGTYGAAVIQGSARRGTDEVQQRGAVLLRAAFNLIDRPFQPRTMEFAADKTRFTLVSADVYSDPAQPLDLLREGDFALEKALADILVEGFTSDNGGCVKVEGEVWRRREKVIPPQFRNADTSRNLFGWHMRTEPGRYLPDDENDPPTPPPPFFSPILNNVYRRSPMFSAPHLEEALAPGAVVQVFRTAGGTDTAYALRLPSASYRARLRIAGTDCPDQPKRWAVAATFPMQADTLILRPDAHQAEMIWRASWPWSDFDQSRLRTVQILKEDD